MIKTINKLVITIIIVLIFLSNNGCVGDQNKIKKEGINKNSNEKPDRNRTPDVPRINIPTRNF